MASTASHTRNDSVPRLPFQTPVLHHTAYKQTTVQTASSEHLSAPKTATASKPAQPSLNVITGFDNPRTPPPPGYTADSSAKARGHRRKESIQERRAKAKTEEVKTVAKQVGVAGAAANVSPSDRMVFIGFDNAVKTLNIQTSLDHIISPITPSIIVTGVPKDDGSSSDEVFLRPHFDKHRSSYYSQPTNAVVQMPFQSNSAASTPPVPVIPHDVLDPNRTLPGNRSLLTSWSTDFEDEDDRSLTYVGSTPPTKDDSGIILLGRTDTTATSRSKGWWNEITTPFLGRSATLRTMASKSSLGVSSPLSLQPSPQPSPQPSSTGSKLTLENVAALDRDVPTSDATTPHPADEKRATMAFFGEATPKTTTFPDVVFPNVPPIPQSHQGQFVKSPEFVEVGAFGEAAEYYEACWHDVEGKERFFKCVNHDCSRWQVDAHADADERENVGVIHNGSSDQSQRELFNQMIKQEHIAKKKGTGAGIVAGAAAGALTGAAVGAIAHHELARHQVAGSAVSESAEYAEAAQTPSISSHVDPSDSVSQVAERALTTAPSQAGPSTAARSIPEPKATIDSDVIGSPEVAEAMAMPIVRGVSPVPTSIRERPAHVKNAPSVALTPASHLTAERSIPASAATSNPSGPSATVTRALAVAPVAAAVAASSHHASDGGIPPPPPPPPAAATTVAAADHEIGVARSLPSPEPVLAPSQNDKALPSTPGSEPEPATASSAPTRNPFRRVPVPLKVDTPSNSNDAVSPGAMTPGLSHEAEVGNAVPMSAPRAVQPESVPAASAAPTSKAPAASAPAAAAIVAAAPLVQRGLSRQKDQGKSTPSATGASNVDSMPTEAHRAAPSPPTADRAAPKPPSAPQPVFVPDGARFGAMPAEQSRGFDDHNEKPSGPKKPNKFALMLARWKEARQKKKQKGEPKKPRTKEEKKRRRWCCGIFCCLLMMIILILVLVLTLTIPRHDMSVQSSWLNLTDFPPLPTGVATIARPNAVKEESGCVLPSTMWSCALPKEDQDGIKPNAPNQPNFRIELRFKNDSSITKGITVGSNNTRRSLQPRDSFTDNLFNSIPAPPSIDDQKFIGNTTDHNSAPFEGEATPFFISFLPTVTKSNAFSKRQDDNSGPGSGSSSSPSSSVPSSSSSTSSAPSSSSSAADIFPNVTAAIPSPAINPDGTAASATLYPLPSAQPLRLYNRGKADEHYGFYTYFDRSIFLTSARLANNSWSYNTADVPGGAPESAASLRCTWAQTRFLVQIWTRMDPGTAQLLNGSVTAEAAAAGNITANSQSNFNQPGSFPYPVTLTLDRHGGDARQKMVYCYDMQGMRVNDTSAKLTLEARGFGGSIVNPAGRLFGDGSDPTAKAGGVDGGTGGCGCVWQNWQQIGTSSGSRSGSGSGTTGSSSAGGSGSPKTGASSKRSAGSGSDDVTATIFGRRRRRTGAN